MGTGDSSEDGEELGLEGIASDIHVWGVVSEA